MTVGDVARPPLAMAYSRRKAEQIVTGLEDPINQHLLKLMAFDGGAREHWRRELDTWLTRIAGIVWTRTNRPFDAASTAAACSKSRSAGSRNGTSAPCSS